QATVTTDPCERSFDDPPFREHLKSGSVRSLDDLQASGTGAPHRHRHPHSTAPTKKRESLGLPYRQVGGGYSMIAAAGWRMTKKPLGTMASALGFSIFLAAPFVRWSPTGSVGWDLFS